MKEYILLAVILLIMFYKYTNSVNNFIGGEEKGQRIYPDTQNLETQNRDMPSSSDSPPPQLVSMDEYNKKLKEIDILNSQVKRYDTRIKILVKENNSMRASRKAKYLMNRYDTDPKNGMISYGEIFNKENPLKNFKY